MSSIPETRAALVAALDTLPELDATGWAPPTIVAGAAWVVLSRAEPVNYCVLEADWFAYVALPGGDNQTTVTAGDALIDPVIAALKPIAKVLTVEPWPWPVEPGQAAIPVLRFTLEA